MGQQEKATKAKTTNGGRGRKNGTNSETKNKLRQGKGAINTHTHTQTHMRREGGRETTTRREIECEQVVCISHLDSYWTLRDSAHV